MSSSKNFLPLLAVTVLVLSVGLINFSQVSDLKVTNRQNVLSDSDENKVEEIKNEEKKEETKQVERKEVEKEETKEKIETKSEVKLTTGKIKVDGVEDEDEAKNDLDDDKNETDNKTEEESEFEQESETVSSDGTVSKFKFKLKTKTVNGKTIIETAKGEMEVKNNPEDSMNDLVNDGVIDTPTSFEAKTNKDNKVEFEVQGVEIKRLLGLFEVNLPKTVTVDAETGDVVDSNQSIWTQFLSLLSI